MWNLFKRRDKEVHPQKIRMEETYVIIGLSKKLESIECKLDHILKRMGKMSETLDSIFEKVSNESSVIDSVKVLLDGIRQQLADAIASGTPINQDKIDAIFGKVTENDEKLAGILSAGTPVTPAEIVESTE